MSRRKVKLSMKERIIFVERYLKNEASITRLAKETHVSESTMNYWVNLHENEGAVGLLSPKKNRNYPKELNLNAVHDYLCGKGSLVTIAKKYGLRSPTQLRQWIKIYNTHRNFKSESGGSRMRNQEKQPLKNALKLSIIG